MKEYSPSLTTVPSGPRPRLRRCTSQYLRMSNGEQNVTDYAFLPPTAENLAKLRPEIPAGYTRATRAEVTGPKPETVKK